jgi:Ca2+-binding EF-hand superfamily protein
MRSRNFKNNSRRHWAPVIATASALLVASCSSTDGFKAADTNKNGSVSKSEFERYMLEAIYAEADANRDSKITFEEWKAANPETKKSRFKAPDTNSDGSITPAEAEAHFDRQGTLDDLFSQIDTNGDKSLSRAEIVAFKEKMAALSGTPIQKISQSTSAK